MQNFKVIVFLFFTSLFGFYTLSGQDLENDKMVMLMKANVLSDQGRYDEAVRMYNRIINNDEFYAPAYFKRGIAKYHLAAYKGTKIDMLRYIDLAGITNDVIPIMARTELKLNNLTAAKNYIGIAIDINPYEGELFELQADIALESGSRAEACRAWSQGAALGHEVCQEQLNLKCQGISLPKEQNQRRRPQDTSENTADINKQDINIPDSTITELETDSLDSPVEVIEEMQVDRTAVYEYQIDESLSLLFTDGLGARQIEEIPDIFLISSNSGTVALDLCVNQDGRVQSVEVSRENSDLRSPSIISLALRKSREFVFIPSLHRELCGRVYFKIKA